MKNLLLFGGENYYPDGGFDDFLGDFDNMQDVEKRIKLAIKSYIISEKDGAGLEGLELNPYVAHWFHVFDIAQKKIVWRGEADNEKFEVYTE